MSMHTERTSDLLLRFLDSGDSERVLVGELVDGLGDRAFGIVLLVLALPNWIPGPPGPGLVFGAPMLIFAVQLMLGQHRLWLPGILRRRSFARADLRRIIERALPYLRRFENFCKPRLAIMTEGVGERLLGVLLFFLAAVLTLPVPFTNTLLGVTIAVIAVGIIEQDGYLILGGWVLGFLAMGITLSVGAAFAVAVYLAIGHWF
jgi:hypothetical protein